MALVITLSILVLMIGLVMAFFSRVLLDRTIRGASAARDQSVVLARSATAIIVGDLLQEIAAGSEADPAVGAGVAYFSPLTAQTPYTLLGSTIRVSKMPSIVPQKNVSEPLAAAHPNLLKQSRSGEPFFVIPDGADTGYALRPGIGTPSARASAVSTTNSFQQTRAIPATSWEWPGLGHAAPPANSAPDWIYLDRSGNTPVFASNEVGTAKEQAATNPDFVIGRFAYRVYDVGGLLDLNQFGDPVNPDGEGNRANLASFALEPLPALSGLVGADLISLAGWREGDADGSREFVSRREMLRTLTARGELPGEASRWFHVGSKFTERPSYRIDPELITATPASLNADSLNPPLPEIRFASEALLSRGSGQAVTVAAGTPLLARKFPLRKIDLLSDPAASAADLEYYFGLARQGDGSFHYTAANDALVIKTLVEVAAESPPREPNFFEVLQAVIATGSLGRDAGNTYTVDHERDGRRSIQTWQIGANILDQWDTDDFPTTIRWQNPNGDWEPIYGVENLPYFNSVAVVGHRPVWDRNRFQLWAVFDVWNPHQNATTLPAGIDSFQIVPRPGGLIRTNLTLAVSGFPPAMPSTVNGTNVDNGTQSVFDLNTGRSLEFPAAAYSSPTSVGSPGPPLNDAWNGGVLLYDFPNVPPAVPPNIHERQAEFSELINGQPSSTPPRPGLNGYLAAAGLPTIGAEGGTFGAKAHNSFRVRSTPTDKLVVDLQYRKSPTGPWITYQSIDGFLPRAGVSINVDPVPLRGGSDGSSTVADGRIDVRSPPNGSGPDVLLQHSLLSENPANTNSCFYQWRFDASPDIPTDDFTRTGFTMVKYDPRTVRFGHNDLRRPQQGRTIRQSIATPVFPGNNIARDLSSNWMMLRAGNETYIAGVQSIYTLQPANAMEMVTGAFGSTEFLVPFGYIANIPEIPLSAATNPSRYRDRDGVIRPGDGYLGAVPTAIPLSSGDTKGSRGDRPLLLNRPFVSVGEMGYAFRDLPWKSLDFFTRNSGDLGLLDAFTIDPVEGDTPLVEGKVNLNSVSEPVLAALLQGSGRLEDGTKPLTETEAAAVAKTIVDERTANGPYSDVGDVVRRALTPTAHNVDGSFVPADHRKAEREAAIRTLSALGDTRTWNLLIDLVVQPGRFGPAATSPDQFQAKGEKRYWVHLSLDRFTGELVHQHWEPVYE